MEIVNNKFFKGHNGLESLVEYKKNKRQNIKKLAIYLILGATMYGIVYTCSHREPKIKMEIYKDAYDLENLNEKRKK